jgi:Spy/CpxP family protein refolding chaperone
MEQSTSPNSRRRFFRLAGLGTAAAGLGTLAFGALAHGRRRGGAALDPAAMQERLERMLKHAYVEIDATPAQQQKIDPLVKQAAEELRPLRQKVREARREGLKLFSAESIDRAAIERLRQEQIAAADAASQRLTRALADVAEVLTPEQRKTLAVRFARRHRGRG